MKKKSFFIIFLFVFWGNNLPCPNSEALQAKNQEEELQYEVIVTLKLVQVRVTDRQGNPVSDLNQSDFILYDNGKLQEITEFERHILLQPEEIIQEEKSLPAPKISPKMNRKFFFLLDIPRNAVPGIVKSKRAALHFMDTQIQPDDEVGVLSYSAWRGLILHEYLTTDHQKVREIIKQIKEIPGRKGVVSPIGMMGKSARIAGKDGMIDVAGREMKRVAALEGKVRRSVGLFNASDFVGVVKELAKSLRYIPGNKNIILFSTGLPRSLLFGRGGDEILLANYEDMIKELATSNSPVYTVNTEGAPTDLKSQGARGDHSLKMLSDLTGGEYFSNVDYYEEIAHRIQRTTSNYYVLGYYVDERWDGKYHEIRVEVKRKGCIVSSQGGYFNPKSFKKYSEFEKQLHLLDLALSEKPKFQAPLNFPLITLLSSNKDESSLVMLSEIDQEKIEEVVKEKAEIVTLIFDNQNEIVDFKRGEGGFSDLPSRNIYHYTISSLLPGKYECRIIIRNLTTGKGAVASSSVVIPESLGSGIRLYPPLLLMPGGDDHYAKLLKDKKIETEREPHSLMSIYPFDSLKYSPLVEELNQGISKLLAVVKCSIIDIQEPKVEFSAYLIQSSTEQSIPLAISILSAESDKEETDILLMEFQIPELQAGEYSLNLIAEEITTQSRSHVTRAFIVK